MNSRVLLFFLTGALVLQLHALELAPELAPLAAKYKADSAALGAQKTAEIARLAQVYGASLDSAEKMETTAGHVTGIAAIAQERGDLQKNEIKTELPAALPKSLHTPRKIYLDGLVRIDGDFSQRKERINADYLRTLAALQTRIGNNPALAQQVNEEKERILNEATGSGKAALLGKWILTTNGAQFWRVLRPDGTMTCNNEPTAKWRVVGGVVQFVYANGVVEEYTLPVHNGKMTGKKNNGDTITAEKAKN